LAGYTQPLNTTDLTPFARVGTHFVNNTCVVLNTVIHTLGKTMHPASLAYNDVVWPVIQSAPRCPCPLDNDVAVADLRLVPW